MKKKLFTPETTEDLRKVSGTKNFSKIFEPLISDPSIADMAPNMDNSQGTVYSTLFGKACQ